MAEDAGEKVVANIASLCPVTEAEHLDTARTRKTACGVNRRLMTSSVLFRPGFMIVLYRSEATSTMVSPPPGMALVDWKEKR